METPKNFNIKKRFGDKVKKLRKQKGLSQERLALNAGIERSYMGLIERGKGNPTLEKIGAVAKALGVSPQELLGYKP